MYSPQIAVLMGHDDQSVDSEVPYVQTNIFLPMASVDSPEQSLRLRNDFPQKWGNDSEPDFLHQMFTKILNQLADPLNTWFLCCVRGGFIPTCRCYDTKWPWLYMVMHGCSWFYVVIPSYTHDIPMIPMNKHFPTPRCGASIFTLRHWRILHGDGTRNFQRNFRRRIEKKWKACMSSMWILDEDTTTGFIFSYVCCIHMISHDIYIYIIHRKNDIHKYMWGIDCLNLCKPDFQFVDDFCGCCCQDYNPTGMAMAKKVDAAEKLMDPNENMHLPLQISMSA